MTTTDHRHMIESQKRNPSRPDTPPQSQSSAEAVDLMVRRQFHQEKHRDFFQIYTQLLPSIGTSDSDRIVAQIIIILKLEGLIGETLSDRDIQLIHTLKHTVMNSPHNREFALSLAKTLIEESPCKES